MWLKSSRAMGPSAVVGVIALIAIEYAANGGSLIANAPDPTFHARLERGACLGPCPVYAVDIDAAGDTEFTGFKSTIEPSAPCQGVHHGKITTAAVAALALKIDASGFFALKPSYRGPVTDQPQYTVTITRRGRTKTVTDYAGLSVGMPRSMVDLETAIDAAAADRACVFRSGAPA